MKQLLLRAGILTLLTSASLGLIYKDASAETDLAAKCKSYGAIKQNTNPSFQFANCLLTNAALEANIPPEVVKAVATQENGGWAQFKNGKPLVSDDGGIGIMQITNQSNYNQEKLKNDVIYNIQSGVEILSKMYDRTDLPKIKNADRWTIENWYFPVMAYNGTKPVNSPLYKATGLQNKNAYQEKVFYQLEMQSFLNDPYKNQSVLAKIPFSTKDFQYDPNSTKNIVFLKKLYTVTGLMHSSSYRFKTGDKVIVTQNLVNLRKYKDSTKNAVKLSKNTTLIITGNFLYPSSDSQNQFVWYPVKTENGKLTGYISSAYIMKKLGTPTVNTVTDHSTVISGKSESNTTVYLLVNNKQIGNGVAKNGAYSIHISTQKAGTTIVVYAKNNLNNKSSSKTIKVIDKTPPIVPSVNKITYKTVNVTGTGEKASTIFIYNGSKKIGQGIVDSHGKFSVRINLQKKGSTLRIFAQDKSGNKSISKYTKVS